MSAQSTSHQAWTSKIFFLFASVGAAVGLGNIWKFPYTAGHNGGGAFLLIYILSILFIVAPILIAEFIIGRHGRMSPVNSVKIIAIRSNVSPSWQVFGWLGMLTTFLILSFYSVIAGWILAYIPKTFSGALTDLNAKTSQHIFETLLNDPLKMSAWHGLFMALTIIIVAKGLHKGIEKAIGSMMPALFFMLLVMVIYAISLGDLDETVRFLLQPDFHNLTTDNVLAAVGQAFFSVSVGVGGMMTYAAYLNTPTNIAQSAYIIAGVDTIVALLAGFAIFPIVFKFNIDPAAGPGLIFIALTTAFSQMPFGNVFAAVFFILLLFAALSSSIALLEPIISWCEEQKKWRRESAALLIGIGIWIFGLATVLSFSTWSNWHPLYFLEPLSNHTVFALIDDIVTKIFIPVGAMILSIFVGWRVKEHILKSEFGVNNRWLFRGWLMLTRYAVPIVILVIFLNKLV